MSPAASALVARRAWQMTSHGGCCALVRWALLSDMTAAAAAATAVRWSGPSCICLVVGSDPKRGFGVRPQSRGLGSDPISRFGVRPQFGVWGQTPIRTIRISGQDPYALMQVRRRLFVVSIEPATSSDFPRRELYSLVWGQTPICVSGVRPRRRPGTASPNGVRPRRRSATAGGDEHLDLVGAGVDEVQTNSAVRHRCYRRRDRAVRE